MVEGISTTYNLGSGRTEIKGRSMSCMCVSKRGLCFNAAQGEKGRGEQEGGGRGGGAEAEGEGPGGGGERDLVSVFVVGSCVSFTRVDALWHDSCCNMMCRPSSMPSVGQTTHCHLSSYLSSFSQTHQTYAGLPTCQESCVQPVCCPAQMGCLCRG